MSSDTKTCISCGMPMRTTEEHALGDVTKPFCKFCGGADGALKSYDDVLAGMSMFLQHTQGLSGDVARETAKTMMAKMPAWSGR